jgi:hypothetical protein
MTELLSAVSGERLVQDHDSGLSDPCVSCAFADLTGFHSNRAVYARELDFITWLEPEFLPNFSRYRNPPSRIK